MGSISGLGGFWKDSGRILEDSDRILEGFWEDYVFWEDSGVILKILEDFWKDSKRILVGFWILGGF